MELGEVLRDSNGAINSFLDSGTVADYEYVQSRSYSVSITFWNGRTYLLCSIVRYSPSPPQHPPPQPPIRGRSSHTSNAAGSASVPASPILQPRHFGDNGGGGGGSIGTSSNPFCPPPGYVLPRHLTPEPQRRNLGQRFEL